MFCATYPCTTNTTGVAGQIMAMLLHTLLPVNLDKENLYYDFIVVGAGSAGSAIASRLSENTNWRVLLIEAGGDPPIYGEAPELFFALMKTKVDWQYYTEPNPSSCMGFKEGRCSVPRGKMLGGTSSMNGMIYNRGNKNDYDTWEKMGNPEWSYEDVLKYFKKSEDLRSPEVLAIDEGRFHGTGGCLKVDDFYDRFPIKDMLFEAARELGYQNVIDINGEKIIGYTALQGTLDNGTRCSSAKAFLSSERDNLHILKNSMVTKILIDQSNKAIGVSFTMNGGIYEARSSKEVIVSCGSINSPQLLMLSGIGPRDHLEALDITVRADLPVGKNLQDHSYAPIWIKVNRDDDKKNPGIIHQVYDYSVHRSGPLAGIFASNLAIHINTFDKNATYPNAMLSFVYVMKGDILVSTGSTIVYGFIEETAKSIIESSIENDNIIFLPIVLNPLSRGEIRLKSNNYLDAPIIHGNYYSHPTDVETALDIIRFYNTFLGTEAMKKHQAEFVHIDLPNCRNYQNFTEDYWRCYIRNVGTGVHHPSGSVKMGPANDPSSVVDARLKVHGIRCLRVADASIMPKLVRGNANAPTIMIGEKAADMIKKDWD